MLFLRTFLLGITTALTIWFALFYSLLGTGGDSTLGIYQTYSLKKQIMQEIRPPRIVVVGGSGTLMGIGADIISKNIGIPVVNFGIYAGLDLDYQLYLLDDLTKPGDIVLFAFEYSAYAYKGKISDNTRNYVIERDKEYFNALPIHEQLRATVSIGPSGMIGLIKAATLPSIDRSRTYPPDKINEYGDQLVNREPYDEKTQSQLMKKFEPIDFSLFVNNIEESKRVLQKFIEKSRRTKDMKFLATFPNTLYFSEYESDSVQTFASDLTHFFTSIGVNVLGSPKDFMYPKDYFFDTNYHLNKKGVIARSEALSALLLNNSKIQIRTKT